MKNKVHSEIKEEIIYNVLLWLDLNDANAKSNALIALLILAKAYHVKIKRKVFRDQKKALRDFVKNDSGYMITLNNLYNSLI